MAVLLRILGALGALSSVPLDALSSTSVVPTSERSSSLSWELGVQDESSTSSISFAFAKKHRSLPSKATSLSCSTSLSGSTPLRSASRSASRDGPSASRDRRSSSRDRAGDSAQLRTALAHCTARPWWPASVLPAWPPSSTARPECKRARLRCI